MRLIVSLAALLTLMATKPTIAIHEPHHVYAFLVFLGLLSAGQWAYRMIQEIAPFVERIKVRIIEFYKSDVRHWKAKVAGVYPVIAHLWQSRVVELYGAEDTVPASTTIPTEAIAQAMESVSLAIPTDADSSADKPLPDPVSAVNVPLGESAETPGGSLGEPANGAKTKPTKAKRSTKTKPTKAIPTDADSSADKPLSDPVSAVNVPSEESTETPDEHLVDLADRPLPDPVSAVNVPSEESTETPDRSLGEPASGAKTKPTKAKRSTKSTGFC